MSLKESIRRREIRNHGYVTAACVDHEGTKKIYQPKVLPRNIPLKELDHANSYIPDLRIHNTLEFFKSTLEIFTKEYNELPKKDERSLRALIRNYKCHINKLLTFDAEVEFNKTTYTKNLAEQFVLEIAKLNEQFLNILKPKQQTASV